MNPPSTPSENNHQVERVRARYAAAAGRVAAGHDPGLADDSDQTACFGVTHYRGELTDDLPVEASLGCGNPVMVADLNPGETVLDLGSGAGLDVLLSARRVGPTGRAIGLDMTTEMLHLSRRHAAEAGVANVEFVQGRIEDIPLPDGSVDVVISNCVITLSVDKPRVFAEITRVLRPGGRIGISDVLADAALTDDERAAGADRVECLASSLTVDQYVALLVTTGLTGIELRRTLKVGDKLHAAIIRAAVPLQRKDNSVRITPMTIEHAEQTLTIYQVGLDTGDASFETTAPTWDQWDTRHLPVHRFVACDRHGKVLGWIAASPVSSRCVYSGVLEHSIYVHPEHQGRGVGRVLLAAYIAATEAAGIWTLQTGIFPENTASLALHQHAGFRTVGRRDRIGQHHGQWRDVLLIEHRTDTQ